MLFIQPMICTIIGELNMAVPNDWLQFRWQVYEVKSILYGDGKLKKKNVLHMEWRFLNKRPMDRVALLNNNFESRSSYLNMKFFIL